MSQKVGMFDLIRSTCLDASKNAKHVQIDHEALEEFANSLDTTKVKRTVMNLPVNFDTLGEEINFLVLFAILNFGSGYRHKLHKLTGRGAAETIQYGLISLVLGEKRLDAFDLCQITHFDIERNFRIPYKVEAIHPTNPIVRIQVDSEVKPFVDKLVSVCNECGRILRTRSKKDFGEYVMENIKKYGTAEKLVEELVRDFPAFIDIGATEDKKVIYFMKKAQLAVGELYGLKDREPLFDFPDIAKLTIFVDNVIPAVLIKEGILIPSKDLSDRISKGVELKSGVEECELRACAITACEEIVAKSGKITPLELDYYIWGTLGKIKEYREFERHYCPDTIFY
jgi:hypothetical protein